MKLIWLTDSHFQLDVTALRRQFNLYVESIAAQKPDAVLLGGDLCNRTGLGRFLTAFRDIVRSPIFCVLGNHEYFGALATVVRTQITVMTSIKPGVTWVSGASEPIWLTDGVALIGADTWGDARAGNLSPRNLRRRGHQLLYDQIKDIRLLWDSCGSNTECIAGELKSFLRIKGDEEAIHLDRVGRRAAEYARQVLILTHAPPFPQATFHLGKEDRNGLPFFCAQAVGDAIKQLAEAFPTVGFTVLAGHTHCGSDVKILPNLRVLVHDPGGMGSSTRWAVLEVDSQGLTWQKPAVAKWGKE